MKQRADMLILGGGPAGYTAALYGARAGFDTLVIEKAAAGGQMTLTGGIDNYPGFEDGIDGFTLGAKMQKGAERFGAKTEYAKILSVDFSGVIKRVETTVGTFYGKTVVIATGANPKELGLKNEQALTGKGVHYCAHCDGRFYKSKTVVVVGGGNSAAADALYLSHLAKQVLVVHRRDTLRATKLYREPLMNAQNVTFLWDSVVEKLSADSRLNGVTVKNLKTGMRTEVACDGVFVDIGRKPATEFLADSVALDEHGYIAADVTTRTNLAGVFAVGDVRTKALRQIVTAVSDGAVAVHFAEEYLSQTHFSS